MPAEALGTLVVRVSGVHACPVEAAMAVLAALRDLGEPLVDTSGPGSFADTHELDRFPDGRRYPWHSLYATDIRPSSRECWPHPLRELNPSSGR
jgi:hypothetical protein